MDSETVADPLPNRSWKQFRACAKLNTKQTKLIEEKLDSDPFNLGYRVALLSSYAHNKDKSVWHRERFCEILGWFIENYPSSFLTRMAGIDDFDVQDFRKLKRKWMRQVRLNDGNLDVLRNAARFCANYDTKCAEKLLNHGKLIDSSPLWPFELLKLYVAKFGREQTRNTAYKKAISEWTIFVNRTHEFGLPDSISHAEIMKIQTSLRKESSIRSAAPPNSVNEQICGIRTDGGQ